MIILAHDGTLYGDWVACYAMRFAATEADRKLLLLHVFDGQVERSIAEARFANLAKTCAENEILLHQELLAAVPSVHRALRQAIPHDPSALLICGTRVKPRREAFLTGSVAAQLLRMHQCPVLALRVVQPGLLGHPHRLLLPLAGHLDGFHRFWPILQRLAPQLHRIYLLLTVSVSDLAQAHHSPLRQSQLRLAGEQYLDRICAELARQLPEPSFSIDRRVLIGSDWSHQVLIEASRLKTQMLLLGASERSLAHRVLHGQRLEQILREASCDVGIYRGP